MTALDPTLLIGFGNRDRGDDAVGPVICDLVATLFPSLRTIVLESSSVDLSSYWEPDDRVVIVDAAQPDDHPGRVLEYDSGAGRFAIPASLSTHSIDVSGAVELARTMNRLPAELRVVAIEGESFEYGAPLTAAVQRSAGELVARFGHLAVEVDPDGDQANPASSSTQE